MTSEQLETIRKVRLGLENGREQYNIFLARLFLQLGSVEAVLKMFPSDELGIGAGAYTSLLRRWDGSRWGLIKAPVGRPRSEFVDLLNFFHYLLKKKLPVEALWRELPESFRLRLGSSSTIHRVLRFIKDGLTTDFGFAAIVSPESNRRLVLTGNDFSPSNVVVGKTRGDVSLPMGWFDPRWSFLQGLHRAAQREMWTDLALSRQLPYHILPSNPQHIMDVRVMDTLVHVLRVVLPDEYCDRSQFSSVVLKDYRFLPVEYLAGGISPDGGHYREGLREIGEGYETFLRCERYGISYFRTQYETALNANLRLAYQTV